MKFLLILCLFISTSVAAKEALIICPLYYLSSVKKTVVSSGKCDKFKHCAISCLLTLRCPATDVMELGIIKELVDVVGPGNAEIDDLKADYHGIELVISRKATTDKSCLDKCHLRYPENSCRQG